jgi:hypothetical protein
MAKFWKLLAECQSTSTSYVAAAGTNAPSPYNPQITSKLIGIRAIAGRTAATTLMDQAQIKLTCSSFNLQSIEVIAIGSGLQTVPMAQPTFMDFDCDQPVSAGVGITIEQRMLLANAVTPEILIMGLFQV